MLDDVLDDSGTVLFPYSDAVALDAPIVKRVFEAMISISWSYHGPIIVVLVMMLQKCSENSFKHSDE